MRSGRWLALAAPAAAALLAACGSAAPTAGRASGPTGPGHSSLPPAAEPANSPPPAATPAGVVVPVGPMPEGMDVDPSTGIVAVGTTQGVVLINESGQVLARVSLAAGPKHIGLVAPGGPFIAPAEGAGEVALVQEPTGRVEDLIPAGHWPHDIAAAAGRIFIGNELSSTVTVASGGQVIATVPVVTQPGGLAAVGTDLAVVGVRARRLELIDDRTLREIASVPAETGPSHVVAAGGRLYVVDTGGGHLLTYAVTPRLHQVSRLSVPASPLGMSVDVRRNRLWVTSTATNRLVELSLSGATARIVTTFPTVRQPDSVTVDSHTGTVFVAGTAGGVVQILHPDGAGRG